MSQGGRASLCTKSFVVASTPFETAAEQTRPPQGERNFSFKPMIEPFVLRSRRLCGGVSKHVPRDK